MSRSGQFEQLAALVRERPIAAAIGLGSGMGPVADRLQRILAIPFIDVPGLEATSVAGHSGRLTLGEGAGRRVLIFEGRQHFYECGNWRNVVAPVHTAKFLGASVLLLTNAAGGIHPAALPGSLMVIRGHLEWTRPAC